MQQCCSNFCIDTTSDISSCGACGRACDSTHVTTPGCTGNVCAPACANGYGDCNHPVAPNADDGCETSLHDVMHCGGCNTVCSLPHATAKCPSGTCEVMACSGGFFDCDPAKPGCECAGSTALGGNGCCTTNCQAAHNNGYMNGDFYDCEVGITAQAATDAAITYKPSAKNTSAIFSGSFGTVSAVCYVDPGNSEAISWAYADTAGVLAGRTHRNSTGTCIIPSITDGMWH
jgi:hypothetical protein